MAIPKSCRAKQFHMSLLSDIWLVSYGLPCFNGSYIYQTDGTELDLR